MFEESKRLSTLSFIVTIYTLVVTFAIAVFIYLMQRSDAEKEKEKRTLYARRLLYQEIKSGFFDLIFAQTPVPGIGSSIKDYMTGYLMELQEVLSESQMRCLHRVVHIIDFASRDQKNRKRARAAAIPYFRPWIQEILKSDYLRQIDCVFDEEELLRKDIFDLLGVLKGEKRTYKEKDEIYDMSGNLLFRRSGKSIEIYDRNQCLANGEFGYDKDGDYRVLNGFLTRPEYVGTVRNGQMHGEGKRYVDGLLVAEGQYEQGKLMEGKKYHQICFAGDDEEQDYEGFSALLEYLWATNLEHYSIQEFRISKGQIVERKSEGSLVDFVKQEATRLGQEDRLEWWLESLRI